MPTQNFLHLKNVSEPICQTHHSSYVVAAQYMYTWHNHKSCFRKWYTFRKL